MEINIGEIVSTIRAVSDESVLSPKALEEVVTAVLAAVEQRDAHKARVDKENQVGRGIRSGHATP